MVLVAQLIRNVAVVHRAAIFITNSVPTNAKLMVSSLVNFEFMITDQGTLI